MDRGLKSPIGYGLVYRSLNAKRNSVCNVRKQQLRADEFLKPDPADFQSIKL